MNAYPSGFVHRKGFQLSLIHISLNAQCRAARQEKRCSWGGQGGYGPQLGMVDRAAIRAETAFKNAPADRASAQSDRAQVSLDDAPIGHVS